MEKELEPIKDLEFVITDEMREILFKMIIIKQIIEKEKISKRERKMLEKHKKELLDSFRKQLHILNPKQIAIARAFLSSKKI